MLIQVIIDKYTFQLHGLHREMQGWAKLQVSTVVSISIRPRTPASTHLFGRFLRDEIGGLIGQSRLPIEGIVVPTRFSIWHPAGQKGLTKRPHGHGCSTIELNGLNRMESTVAYLLQLYKSGTKSYDQG